MSYTTPTDTEAAERRLALQPFDEYNIRACVYSVYALFGTPVTHLDLGSGSGAVVKAARRLGVDAVGVDVIAEAPDIAADLTKPLEIIQHDDGYALGLTCASGFQEVNSARKLFTLINCVEVAEHLPPEAASVLCATIRRHLATRGWLIFTSALPGQAGDHHQNLIPPFEWRGLMYEHDLVYVRDVTAQLALLWSYTSGNLQHLPANLQLFTTKEGW